MKAPQSTPALAQFFAAIWQVYSEGYTIEFDDLTDLLVKVGFIGEIEEGLTTLGEKALKGE